MPKFILSGFADEIASQLEEQISGLQKNGIGCIEVRGVDGQNISMYTPKEAEDIRRRLDAGGIKVSALGSPVGKIGLDDPAEFESHLAMFKTMLEVAGVLGTKYMRMFSFFLPKGDPAEAHRDEVMRRLERFVKAAEGSGVILTHENEHGIYGEKIEGCVDIMKTFGGAIRTVFDPGNFVCAGVDPRDAYPELRPYMEYLHIKDARQGIALDNSERDMGFQNVSNAILPAGAGDGQIEWVLGRLWADGYEGYLSIEPHLINNPDYPGDGLAKFTLATDCLKDIIARVAK